MCLVLRFVFYAVYFPFSLVAYIVLVGLLGWCSCLRIRCCLQEHICNTTLQLVLFSYSLCGKISVFFAFGRMVAVYLSFTSNFRGFVFVGI